MATKNSSAELGPQTTSRGGDGGDERHRAFKPVGLLIRGLVLVATVTLLIAETAWGQSSEAEMQSFPMPPVQGYKAVKTFTYPGDYGYFLSDNLATPTPSFSQGTSADQDYDYFRYTGIVGKNVYLYGAWGTIPIAPPTVNSAGQTADACAHAHLSYGVWGKYMLDYFVTVLGGWRIPIPIGPVWIFLGGGGMSGVRASPSSPCVLTVNDPLSSLDSRFAWGASFLNWDTRGQIPLPPAFSSTFWRATDLSELVLGVQANTHGWGPCGSFACHMPAYSIAFTLP